MSDSKATDSAEEPSNAEILREIRQLKEEKRKQKERAKAALGSFIEGVGQSVIIVAILFALYAVYDWWGRDIWRLESDLGIPPLLAFPIWLLLVGLAILFVLLTIGFYLGIGFICLGGIILFFKWLTGRFKWLFNKLKKKNLDEDDELKRENEGGTDA